jgi:hypothetical protein
MPHNSRVRGSSDAWANILPSELETIETNLAGAINGVEGSTHSPPSAITISGSGLEVTGPLKVDRGGTLTVTAAGAIDLDGGYPSWQASTSYADGTDGDIVTPTSFNNRRYLCTTPGVSGGTQPTWPTAYAATVTDGSVVWTCIGPDGDYPQYSASHAGRTPTVVHSLAGGRPVVPGTWRVRNVDGMVQAVAPMMDISDGNGPQPARWLVPLRMHDTGTVTSVSVSFRVGWPHTALPGKMPGARLMRLPSSGVPQFLTSVAARADQSGYLYLAKPASAAAYAGQQTLTIPCDQNNVVDIANYTYVLELIEEQWSGGPNYPWSLVMKQPVACADAGSVTGSGTGTPVDGVALVAGVTRILVKCLTSNNANGIWIAQSGLWTTAPDLTLPSDFTQGMIVPVAVGGAVNGFSYWQAQTNKASWAGAANSTDLITFLARGPDDDETPGIVGIESFGHGCIWGTASVSYTGITQENFA